MERGLDTLLDYAIFQTSSAQNRYDAIVCCKGQTEKLVSGPLDTLALFLKDAKVMKPNSSNGTFKLQLNDVTTSNWFNKSTLSRFLHAVNSPGMLKSTGGILNEMSQLEETRKFHLSLYSKDQSRVGGVSGGFLDSMGMAQQVNAGTVTSEATKNELLRALDLRLTALNEELAAVFCKAIGSNISSEELSYLTSFVHQFCMPDVRDSISKNLETILNCHPNEQNSGNLSEHEPIKQINTTGVSPAKLAQVERESLTESEDENSSSGEEESETVVERSRPVMRAPSPRRSASPMRRVQIGRSGSRRAQAIAIKSLSYFPSRDRTFDQGVDDSCEEEGDRSTKKTEVNVTRISVKDAISLFECKQKDEGTDGNKKKALGFVSTNKAVLRRWSSGMGDSCTSQNSSTDFVSDKNDSTSMDPERDEKVEEVAKAEIKVHPDRLEPQGTEMEAQVSVTAEEMKSQHEELSDKAFASAEWNRQKEAELNEMLLKMMGAQPGKYGLVGSKPNDQKGDLYSQYKEKRDAKLRGENTAKRVSKQGQEAVNKPATTSKKAAVAKEKKISPIPQQRQPRRNSAPLVAPKKEAAKATTPASSRKASPRASPLPSTRSSLSAGPTTTKSSSSQKIKSSTTLNSSTNLNSSINSNTPISRRRPQVTPSTQPSPKSEKPIKTSKESVRGTKLLAKGQEEKKPKTATNTNRGAKLKNSSSLVDESCPPAKPSLYNKVTKKSSVVPLESKPSLKKSLVPTKVKASATVASPKDSVKSLRQSQEKDMPSPVAALVPTEVPEVSSVPPQNDCDTEAKISPNEKEIENVAEVHLQAMERSFLDSAHGIITSTEVQTEDDLGISSAAWVEEANQLETQVTSEIGEETLETYPAVMEPALSSSPKIRHSLSQMLQADTHEPEIIEWGNAENPPALVFQKDSPKGFKRLLKFARKSNNNSSSSNKGESNSNGMASPSVFSEGEDDVEEYKGAGGRNTGPVQTRGYGPQRGYLSESFDGGLTNKRGIGGGKTSTISSAQSSGINLDKLREGASSTRASRSFFSLSNFRSNKSNETKRFPNTRNVVKF